MFFLALFLAFSGDLFVGSGVGWGTSMTNTEKKNSVVMGAQVYPLSYKKIGFFYYFQFRNKKFPVSNPFLATEKERSHSFGPVFRLSAGRIQPWLGGGLMIYSANTEIRIFDEFLIGESQKRTVPFAVAGVRFRIWKNLYQEVGVNLAGTARPPLQFVAKTVWRF